MVKWVHVPNREREGEVEGTFNCRLSHMGHFKFTCGYGERDNKMKLY